MIAGEENATLQDGPRRVIEEGSLHVLIVGDEDGMRQWCATIVGSLGFPLTTASDTASVFSVLEYRHVDIVLADLKNSGADGFAVLERIKEISPETEVVVMAGFVGTESALQSMRLGVYDCLIKPFQASDLELVLVRLVEKLEADNETRVLRELFACGGGFGQILGTSPPMRKLFKLIAKVRQSPCPVLIQGESGTGKELVARCIHGYGPRASQPFLPIDCGSLAPTLIESELFGYVRGAFTGAERPREGLLEAAGNGTVFLDEIGEMDWHLQSKLLRALQEKEVRPLGANQCVRIAARIIAATNCDIELAVRQGRFREDLYFRLNVVTLSVPPLRDRKDDIPLLVTHLLERHQSAGTPPLAVSDRAMEWLMAYDWPGNVRELENCVQRAMVLGSGPMRRCSDFRINDRLPRAVAAGETASPGPISPRRARYPKLPATLLGPVASGNAGAFVPSVLGDAAAQSPVIPLAELEKDAIMSALLVAKGNRPLAARMLGIGKSTLHRKLEAYGVKSTKAQATGS